MKALYKSLVAATALSSASFAAAGQVYLDIGSDFAADTGTPTKVCPTCTSLKDEFTIKYESSTDVFDTDGSLSVTVGDEIITSGGLAVGGISSNNVTSLNPNQVFGGGSADNGYNSDWVLSFSFTDLAGIITSFDNGFPELEYTSGTIELFLILASDPSTTINFMDLIVTGSSTIGPNISLEGYADFTSVDPFFNNLIHNDTVATCAGSDGFFDIWSSAACNTADVSINFVIDQNTNPALVHVDPALPGAYPLIGTISTNHDGSVRFNVPEPSTLALMGLSLLMFGGVVRKKKA